MLPPTDRMGQVGPRDALRSGHICAGAVARPSLSPASLWTAPPSGSRTNSDSRRKLIRSGKDLKTNAKAGAGAGPLRL